MCAGRVHGGAVRAEGQGFDRVAGRGERGSQGLPALRVPQLKRARVAADGQSAAVGAVRDLFRVLAWVGREDVAQDAGALSHPSVPQGDPALGVARGQPRAVGAEGEGADLVAEDEVSVVHWARGQGSPAAVPDQQASVGADGQRQAGQFVEHSGAAGACGVPGLGVGVQVAGGRDPAGVNGTAGRADGHGHHGARRGGRQVRLGSGALVPYVPDRQPLGRRFPTWCQDPVGERRAVGVERHQRHGLLRGDRHTGVAGYRLGRRRQGAKDAAVAGGAELNDVTGTGDLGGGESVTVGTQQDLVERTLLPGGGDGRAQVEGVDRAAFQVAQDRSRGVPLQAVRLLVVQFVPEHRGVGGRQPPDPRQRHTPGRHTSNRSRLGPTRRNPRSRHGPQPTRPRQPLTQEQREL